MENQKVEDYHDDLVDKFNLQDKYNYSNVNDGAVIIMIHEFCPIFFAHKRLCLLKIKNSVMTFKRQQDHGDKYNVF